MTTPTLDDIATHGNRGHHMKDNGLIICNDGTAISVIAGGGTYSIPRVNSCLCNFLTGDGLSMEHNEFSLPNHEPHDYPGPYTHVEVWGKEPPLCTEDGDPAILSVETVRDFIEAHGGEKLPE